MTPVLPVLRAPWRIRAAEPEGPDLDLVHKWMLAPHVAAFWHQAWTRDRWAEELRRQLAGEHSLPCLLDNDGQPLAYLEIYRVTLDALGSRYPVLPGDLGVHVAIGDLALTGRGVGTALLRAVADGLLAADPGCTRVVAEPDLANEPSIRAFARAGFQQVGEVDLEWKKAALMVRPRSTADLPVLG